MKVEGARLPFWTRVRFPPSPPKLDNSKECGIITPLNLSMPDRVNLREMTEELVEGGFTALLDEKFSVRWANTADVFADVSPFRMGRRGYGWSGKNHVVRVDKCLRSAPRNVLLGVLAHELGHVVDQRKRFVGTDRQRQLRAFFRGDCEGEKVDRERAADLQAILAGFGKQLRACYDYVDSTFDFDSADSPNGLSLNEIDALTELLEEGLPPNEVAGLV